MSPKLRVAVRYMCMTGGILVAVGLAGNAISWPLLTATLGPTAYFFVAHPDSPTARLRNAAVGHAVAIGAGVAALAVFGLWHHPSVSATGAPTLDQVGAAAAAAAVTVALLEFLGSHHAPAAASALLVATGLARPGRPLAALAIGLVMVMILGPLSGRMVPVRVAPQRQSPSRVRRRADRSEGSVP